MDNHLRKMVEMIETVKFNKNIEILNLYTKDYEKQNEAYKLLNKSYNLFNKNEISGYIHNPFACIKLHSNFYLVFLHLIQKYSDEVDLEIFPIFIDKSISLCNNFITVNTVSIFDKIESKYGYNNFLTAKNFFIHSFSLGLDPSIKINFSIFDLPLSEILKLNLKEEKELKEDIKTIFKIYLKTDNRKDIVYEDYRII